MKWTLVLALAVGCSKNDDGDDAIDAPTGGTVTIDETAYSSGTPEGMFDTGEDAEDLLENSTFDKTVTITFGATVQVDNPVGDGVSIATNGGQVIVNATATGVAYILSGTSPNGSFKLYSEKKFKLTLADLSLTRADGPAINIQSGKRAFVVLSGTNSLTDGTAYATAPDGEDQKGTFFSEGQLIFSGSGSITVQGNNNHAIVSDDYIRVISGTITVSGAAKDAIHCNDYFIADGGTFDLRAQSDGIEAEKGHIIINKGDFTINVVDDAIAAAYEDGDTSIDPYVVINGGTFVINTTEGEGIESKSTLTINDGSFVLKTADDAINAGNAIYINGGHIYCQASANDAMDSNGTFTITGGIVIAASSREDGVDCDGNNFKITGGLVIGMGRATSTPTASISTTYSLIAGGVSGSQLIHIEDAAGKEVLTFQTPIGFNTLLFASSKLQANTTYHIYTGGSVTNGTQANGLYTKGTYARGSTAAQFKTGNMVTQIGGQVMRM